MAKVEVGGTTIAWYVYDALGRRISATSGGVTRVSLYLGNDIVYEVDGTAVTKYLVAGGKYLAKVVTQAQAGAAGTLGAAAVVTPAVEPPDGSTSTSTSTKTPPGYIPPPDDRIIIIEPPIIYPPPPDEPPGEEPPPQEPPPSEPQPPSSYGVFYFHTDLVGSIRAVTDSQGQVVARYEYEPFGLTVKAEGPLAGHDVHKFTGKPEDAATGLYYFNARYYDPEVGRFISQDPARHGLNWYVFCEDNPLRYVDPDGEASVPAQLLRGLAIHNAIFGALKAYDLMMGGTVSVTCNLSLRKIWNDVSGTPDVITKSPQCRPDIVLRVGSRIEVYEIKPDSWWRSQTLRAKAVAQLRGYVANIPGATVGTDTIRPLLGIMSAAAQVSLDLQGGIIYYKDYLGEVLDAAAIAAMVAAMTGGISLNPAADLAPAMPAMFDLTYGAGPGSGQMGSTADTSGVTMGDYLLY